MSEWTKEAPAAQERSKWLDSNRRPIPEFFRRSDIPEDEIRRAYEQRETLNERMEKEWEKVLAFDFENPFPKQG